MTEVERWPVFFQYIQMQICVCALTVQYLHKSKAVLLYF